MKQLQCLLLFVLLHAFSIAQTPDYQITSTINAPPGYYFLSPFNRNINAGNQQIVDGNGNLVYYRYSPGSIIHDYKIQPNGLITYFNNHSAHFMVLDSTFTVIDSVLATGMLTDVHELRILSNGHYLLLGNEYLNMDLSAYPYFHQNGALGSTSALVECSVIEELDASKNLVFQWHAKDYLSFNSVDPFFLNDSSIVDWTHANAIEEDTDGNLLLSSRHLNEITKINRSTGSIMWRLGGKYNQFTFLNDTVRFYGQHHIRRLPNGHITLFDNGNHYTPHGARALEYELNEITKTATLVWSYTYDANMYSGGMGSVQRINNKTLVDYGFTSRNTVCFNVVDSSGSEVFNLSFPENMYSYRTFYTSSLPWQLPRPAITCFDSLGVTYLKAQDGYPAYRWSNNSTRQFVPLDSAGDYQVFVPFGNGGYLGSTLQRVQNTGNFCNVTGLTAQQKNKGVNFYPNPVITILNVSVINGNTQTTPLIIDSNGKELTVPFTYNQINYSWQFNTSEMAPGIYLVKYGDSFQKFAKSN